MIISTSGTVLGAQLDTLADRTPLLAGGNYYGNSAVQLSGFWAAYSAIYKNHLWPNLIIRKLAFSTARMQFDIKVHGDGNDQTPEAGPLTELMARPNPRFSGFKLWQWTSSMFDIYGEAFWLKLRDDTGRVRELMPMHPTNITIRREPDGSLVYLLMSGVQNVSLLPPIPEEDVVPFVSFNPDSHNRGISPLEPLRATLLNEDAARRAMESFWRRGLRPGFIITSPKTLSQPAQDRLKAQMDARGAGADRAGNTLLLEEGMVPTLVQLTAEEMQYIESRKLNREEVAAAYDVPAPVVGILDHATFSNITEQLRSQYRDTMAPRFEFMESVVDHHLVPDFYTDGSVFTRFNMDEVLRGDFETRATSVIGLRNAGVLDGNESRAMFGLAPSDDAEMSKIFANAAMVELGSTPRVVPGTATDGTPMPTAIAPPYPKAARAIESKATRSLMGRLGRVKSSKVDTKKALIDEHEKQLSDFFDKQRASVKAALTKKAAGVFKPDDWDEELAGILAPLAAATSKAIGTQTATDLGGTYDPDRIASWLTTDATTSAKNINATTDAQLEAILGGSDDDEAEDDDPDGDVDDFFDGTMAARTSEISLGRVIMVAGLAALVAAEQNNASTKTWIVTSDNPRPSHAAMDGETVPLGQPFSNGMNGPGDFSGGADEVAGCSCELQFNTEDN